MSRPRRYHLHASLGYRLTRAARLAERRFEERLAPLGLTRLVWCVLLAVGEEGLHRPSDIAAFIGVDRAVVSRTLAAMQRRGLIARQAPDGADGRHRPVALTAAGLSLLDASIPVAAENARHFADRLTEDEQDVFLTLLEKLVEGEPPTLHRL